MNKVMLIGRLTRDPEVRYTQSGTAFATFSLAVDRRYQRNNENGQQTADFIPVVAWGKLAEICGHNLVKGRRISIEGRLQVRSYEAQDGSKRRAFDVVAEEMEFLDSRSSSQQGGGYQQNGGFQQGGGYPQNAQGGMQNARPNGQDPMAQNIPDEEIPF